MIQKSINTLIDKSAKNTIEAVVESVEEELAKGGKVQLVGFGTFEARARKARTGRKPQPGEAIQIPAMNHPIFSAGKALKAAVNHYSIPRVPCISITCRPQHMWKQLQR